MDRDVFENMISNYNNHPSQLYQDDSHDYHQTFMDAAHSFFEGNIESEGEIIEHLQDSPHFNVQSQGSQGDAWRSMEYAYQLTRHMENQDIQDQVDDCDQPEQQKAIVQNVYKDEDVQEDIEESNEKIAAIQVMAGSGDGEYQNTQSSNEREQLYQKLYQHPALSKVLKYVGHFMTMANKIKRESYTSDSMSISGAEMGRDVTRVFSSELALLTDVDTEDLFMEKYDKRQLLQFEQEGETNTGQSDVSILIDTSTSMNNLLDREMFDDEPIEMIHVASAFALAMAKQLQQEDRSVQFYSFDWSCQQVFNSEEDDWSEAFDGLLQLTADGGTNTQRALEQSFEDSHNDVIVITDGMDRIDEDFDKGERRVFCLDLAETKEDPFYDAIWRFSTDGVEEIMQEEIQ